MQYISREVYEYISSKNSDPIVEWKICRVSGTEFPIFQSDLDFYNKISPTFAGQRFQIPTPTLCPEERQRRRLMHRNERNFYRTTCQMTGSPMIALYTPDKPWTVYGNAIWSSDKRDPMTYGQDVDAENTIMQQLLNLQMKVPVPNMMSVHCENCDYTSGTGYCKDCYMICASEYAEKCMYSKLCQTAKYILDSANIFDSEHAYESYNLKNCTSSIYLFNASDCYNCHFSDSLIGCSSCIFCTGLQNKQYCLYNKQVTKEEFEQYLSQYTSTTHGIQIGKKLFSDFLSQSITRYIESRNIEKSYGNELFDCKNTVIAYSVNEAEDCKYLSVCEKVRSLQDCNNMYVNPELCYEMMGAIDIYNCHFSTYIFDKSRDVRYSMNCHSCENCFGCIGLRHKSYCIFNKQYTKESYELLVARIIQHMQSTGEWGEFFDYNMAPFGYNESVAQDYYPLTKEKALERGYLRSDYSNDPKIPENAQVIKVSEVSYEAWDVLKSDPNLHRQVILCEVSGRPFMFQKAELEFYQQHHLPLPRRHPDVRYKERVDARPPKTLYHRACACCHTDFVSVYNVDYASKVYCDACYIKAIYG